MSAKVQIKSGSGSFCEFLFGLSIFTQDVHFCTAIFISCLLLFLQICSVLWFDILSNRQEIFQEILVSLHGLPRLEKFDDFILMR